MKFNGEVWMTILNRQKSKNEPDEFVLAKNSKSTGGLIPYARYGADWTTTVPNRILIREMATALEEERNKSELRIRRVMEELSEELSTLSGGE